MSNIVEPMLHKRQKNEGCAIHKKGKLRKRKLSFFRLISIKVCPTIIMRQRGTLCFKLLFLILHCPIIFSRSSFGDVLSFISLI